MDHTVCIDKTLVKCKPFKCIVSFWIWPISFPSIEHITKMFHCCTFIIFLVSLLRLHVSFSQGFLQASQFAKSSRGKPPRSHSLRERERESVCTMARTTRLPRCPAAPLPQYPTSKGGKEKITRKTREDLGKGLLVVLLSTVGGHAGHHWGLPVFVSTYESESGRQKSQAAVQLVELF